MKNPALRWVGVLGLFIGFWMQSAPAWSGPLPFCLDNQRQALPINNAQVMRWKQNTPDQYKNRGYVQGVITEVFPDRTDHNHFAVDLDGRPGGDIEIIYNQDFGALPPLSPGMMVQACGDYITVGPRARRPSPMGAIIHWVHYNPGDRDGGRHPHGFLAIQGRVYGFSTQTSGSSF
jgi:hypothetical protein